ncbi:MAG: polyprenol monophosphomannose synthase [Candidatus Margulisbacteria bacterium]|jgi:dolichol-phosphate mannosyltransferase|nr:polyprenol monophosphomannose synthase [Candidatus Margulisiibacteriota bacterium]
MDQPELSVGIPTYNEAKNIETLIVRVHEALKQRGIRHEIIIVDDSSPDGTAQLATAMADCYPVRVYVRTKREGPGPAILDGIRLAAAPVACIMDGDLSHPPEVLPEMYRLIKEGKARLVIGSRHVKGGGTSQWMWYRKFFSWGARMLGRFLTPVNDLTAGYFMFDKKILDGAAINPIGCKVGLELMVKGNHQGKVTEYPIVFHERAAGESKMGWRETRLYLRHLVNLALWKFARPFRQ